MPIDDEDEDSRYGEEGLTLEEQDRAAEGADSHPRDPEEPSVPSSIKAQDELIDQASDDSFPASDPPAYWQRPATHHSGVKERSAPASDVETETVPQRSGTP
jgi:hypothetical protein